MDLSIVIVNYNVKHFLEQCLSSVLRATRNLSSEVFVVDNNSADGSCSMVLEKFKDVIMIENSENIGFSKANNQALKKAKGKYVLLLNPDTVVHEDSLSECFNFMEAHKDAGAAGLRMIDGLGNFLPESKRSLPTPRSAFYKIFGLAKLFPRSNKFNIYYLQHLDNNAVHKVDILTGAFMFIRSSALKETGLLDEGFFMYAEDIDLSYRLIQKGYSNYYLPSPPIIHFKGESTKKSEFNYPRHFYGSMIRFVKKYYQKRNVAFLSVLLRLAIFLRALLSLIKMTASKLFVLITDFAALALSYYTAVKIWETVKYGPAYNYPDTLSFLMLPLAVLICLIALFVWGAYRKNTRLKSVIAGTITGALALVSVYSILPADFRYSRAIILTWALITPPLICAIRLLFSSLKILSIAGSRKKSASVVIVAGEIEFEKIRDLIITGRPDSKVLGRISVSETTEINSLGHIAQIDEVIRINRPEELIFSSIDLSAGTIISLISRSGLSGTEKKIAYTGSEYIIGSSASNNKGEVFSVTNLKKSISD